eukprot:6197688-Pleurochrysis_carterae.AAC.1
MPFKGRPRVAKVSHACVAQMRRRWSSVMLSSGFMMAVFRDALLLREVLSGAHRDAARRAREPRAGAVGRPRASLARGAGRLDREGLRRRRRAQAGAGETRGRVDGGIELDGVAGREKRLRSLLHAASRTSVGAPW